MFWAIKCRQGLLNTSREISIEFVFVPLWFSPENHTESKPKLSTTKVLTSYGRAYKCRKTGFSPAQRKQAKKIASLITSALWLMILFIHSFIGKLTCLLVSTRYVAIYAVQFWFGIQWLIFGRTIVNNIFWRPKKWLTHLNVSQSQSQCWTKFLQNFFKKIKKFIELIAIYFGKCLSLAKVRSKWIKFGYSFLRRRRH